MKKNFVNAFLVFALFGSLAFISCKNPSGADKKEGSGREVKNVAILDVGDSNDLFITWSDPDYAGYAGVEITVDGQAVEVKDGVGYQKITASVSSSHNGLNVVSIKTIDKDGNKSEGNVYLHKKQ